MKREHLHIALGLLLTSAIATAPHTVAQTAQTLASIPFLYLILGIAGASIPLALTWQGTHK